MANGNDMSENLFSMSRKSRTNALADTLERNFSRAPAMQRFILAGVVTAIDPEIVNAVARVVASELRVRSLRME